VSFLTNFNLYFTHKLTTGMTGIPVFLINPWPYAHFSEQLFPRGRRVRAGEVRLRNGSAALEVGMSGQQRTPCECPRDQ
jgi:hypothetical protein